MASRSSTELPPLGFNPQAALLDTFFPGFSLFSATIQKYMKIDPTIYIPYLLVLGITVFALQHASVYFWEFADEHLMSTADIRVDDEMYNIFMAWLTQQYFAKHSRRFVANTSVDSRNWHLNWDLEGDDDDKDSEQEIDYENDGVDPDEGSRKKKKKHIEYTPSFGNHYFWYMGWPLLFKRQKNQAQAGYLTASEREEISISCFGRNPAMLKKLLEECRVNFLKRDEDKTLIYRGSLRSGSTDPKWTRSMSRVSRPFSTVVLEDSIKQTLVDDLKDYLHPFTRRWYGNRGIPYRRGYLFYGPPGTGKSSLSFAIAGYFKLKIYIVSLNSNSMTEDNLSALFDELPKRCVVLLEDIDTANLTHTREETEKQEDTPKPPPTTIPGKPTPPPEKTGGLSLSALLNVIDGVASQEGRVLIMTTNHIDKLDSALIRPGRVDMKIEFNLATKTQLIQIFEAMFATIEGDFPTSKSKDSKAIEATTLQPPKTSSNPDTPESKEPLHIHPSNESKSSSPSHTHPKSLFVVEAEKAQISLQAKQFADIIPAGTFSPAEVQGYLLKWKRNPEKAVEMAGEWVEEMKILREKKEGEKIKKEGLEKGGEEKGDEVKGEGSNGISSLSETPVSVTRPSSVDGTQC